MNKRILKIRQDYKLTQDEFASRLNLSKNFVWMLEKGNRVPSDRTISDICKEFNVNYEWLVHGTGEIYRDNFDHAKVLIDNLMNGEDNFPKHVLYEFAKLGPEGWAKLKAFIKKMDLPEF